VPLALEQNPQRFQHIALIIGYQNPAHRLTLNREYESLSIALTRKQMRLDAIYS